MSAAAPAARRVAAQARFETGTLLRNGEQLLVALVLPCAALLGLAMTSSPSLGPGRRIDLAVPGVLALCVISSAFTAQAIATGFDRRYGVLRLLGVSPSAAAGCSAPRAVAVLAVEALQLVVIGALGLALGWHPAWSGFVWGAVFAVVGSWAFVALALLLAGVLRAEGVLAVANLLWVALLVLGRCHRPPQPAARWACRTWPPCCPRVRSVTACGRPSCTGAWPPPPCSCWWSGRRSPPSLASRTFRWSD